MKSLFQSPVHKVMGITIALTITLVFARASILGFGYLFPFQGLGVIKKTLLFSYYDVVYTSGTGLFFTAVIFLFRRYQRIVALQLLFVILVAMLSVVWALINVEVVAILNIPINYQLLYNSDLLGSNYVLNLAGAGGFKSLASKLTAMLGGVFLLTWFISVGLDKIVARNVRIALLAIGIILFGIYLAVARSYVSDIHKQGADHTAMVSNPHLYFAASFFNSLNNEQDQFFDVDYSNDLYQPTAAVTHAPRAYTVPRNKQIKNVIIYVMESASAQYFAGYHAKGQMITPNINRYLSQSLAFKHAYTSNPNSTNALFSILSSSYPLISFRNVVAERPELAWPTLNSTLQERGYQTAFFSSTDNSYCRVDEYLSHRKFSTIMDYQTIPCNKGSLQSEAEGVGVGINEACAVDAFFDWVPDQPFFAMFWTVQSHWPYFTFGPEKKFTDRDPAFNKYLNAINETDQALGKLLDQLKERGMAESTLVIVVGDHGEGFGQHREFGHGSNVYEESVHIPLIFINPLLFNGTVQDVIAGQQDIAPTILDILGLDVPKKWQGTSLFNPAHKNESYFFSTWNGYRYGFRKDNYKYIYDPLNYKLAIYDLSKDPAEQNDLSGQRPERAAFAKQQLSQWYRYHKKFMVESMKD